MTGPRLALGTLILGFLLIGFLTAESERDFEFAGEKTTSYSDDEDFMGDQEGSGEEVEGSGTVDRPSGIPALYRVKLNITSLQFTAEIEAARQSRTLGSLAITAQIQRALENLLSSVRGTIRIRIVDFEPGSVMVVFDVDTDGYQTEEDIASALKAALNAGRLEAFRVSPDGFQFNLIRNTEESCSPMVGRPLSSTTTYERNNWANLMINNAFPCNGFVTAWSYYNIAAGSAKIAVIRQTSDTDFEVVSVTDLPYRNSGAQKYELSTPILVRTGDFIGVLYSRQDQGGVIANIRQSDNLVPDSELFQTYYMSAFSEELYEGRRFQMSEFASTERPATFSVQAEMSYENVPDIVVPAPRECGAAEWMCRNRDCIKASYRCDGQVDCYDGTDEQNCVTEQPCRDDEFRCQATKQCISRVFVCDNNDDCGDNSDEVNCGPGRVLVSSYRDGSLSSQYQLQWLRPHSQSSPITYYIIKWRKVTVRTGEITPEGNYVMDQPLTPFYTERVTSDSTSFLLNDLEAATFYQVELSAANNIGQSEPQAFIFRTANPGCAPGQFQCKDGGCIDNQYRCDNSPGDCADDSDEDGCDFGTICSEGLLACPQPDGSVVCTDSLIGCACPEDQFQCLDGRGCISFTSLCDGRVDCSDFSDEDNCECASGEFQCTDDRRCIPESRRCDSRRDCNDNSDELNCPCPRNTFTCKNTEKQECVNNNLLCDGYNDCSDGSDEEDCGCANGFWQCADTSCVPERFRCDGVPQCEDGSDEVACPRPGCRDDQYTCADGNCVEARMRCDGIPQCEDSSDENGCPRCQSDQFNCADGTCVPERFRCDGVPQCEDASDEVGCPTRSCPDSDFQCSTLGRLECIDQRLKCDGIPDCSDGSDERDCPGCRRGEFECSSGGSCIPEGARCNGFFDCEDRSDEAGCVCTDRQFRCGDGLCIDLSRRCDRQTDCNDNSDELACPCRAGEFQCVNGNCVPESARCNGQFECTDRSDEANCPSRRRCRPGFRQCATRHCLQEYRFCDGVRDCPDGSDERNCRSLQCGRDEVECVPDRKCLSKDQICDRVYDCSDQSDELNCPSCTDDEFQCESDRSCISLTGRCNGRKECSDGSDEMNCPTRPPITITVSPRDLRIRAGAEALLTCMATGLPQNARVEWSRGTEGLPMQSAVELGKLMIPVAKPMDSGIYTCRVVGVQGDYSDSARLEVVAIGPGPDPDNGPCGRDEAVCQNGQCIRREYRCDGEKDCEDGSDEPDDCFNNVCEPNEFQCPSGQCVMKIWRCDGEKDCDDGFDEQNCLPKSPSEPCGFDEFECVSGDQCIPLAYQCDQEIDCLDRSDEIGCSAPVITLPPISEIEVELGGTFTIICEAVGVPTPLIVWRLNWGNIPTGDRVTTTSEDGRGVLTVRDARYTDAGAYTCEAINNRGSIFAIPDALVIVRKGRNRQPSIQTSNVLLIGGAQSVNLNTEHRTVLMGVSSMCQTDLALSLDGPRLYCQCPTQGQSVDITYMGDQSVDLEIVKRIVHINVRGDTLPEPERDVIVLHLAGLPLEITRLSKHKQLVQGITSDLPLNQTQIFNIAGRKRNKYNHEKQIIHVGINHRCVGKFQLFDVNGKKALQCVEDIEDRVYSDRGVPSGDSDMELIQIPRQVPRKSRKKVPVSDLERYKTTTVPLETIELSGGRKVLPGTDGSREHMDPYKTSTAPPETIELSGGGEVKPGVDGGRQNMDPYKTSTMQPETIALSGGRKVETGSGRQHMDPYKTSTVVPETKELSGGRRRKPGTDGGRQPMVNTGEEMRSTTTEEEHRHRLVDLGGIRSLSTDEKHGHHTEDTGGVKFGANNHERKHTITDRVQNHRHETIDLGRVKIESDKQELVELTGGRNVGGERGEDFRSMLGHNLHTMNTDDSPEVVDVTGNKQKGKGDLDGSRKDSPVNQHEALYKAEGHSGSHLRGSIVKTVTSEANQHMIDFGGIPVSDDRHSSGMNVMGDSGITGLADMLSRDRIIDLGGIVPDMNHGELVESSTKAWTAGYSGPRRGDVAIDYTGMSSQSHGYRSSQEWVEITRKQKGTQELGETAVAKDSQEMVGIIRGRNVGSGKTGSPSRPDNSAELVSISGNRNTGQPVTQRPVTPQELVPITGNKNPAKTVTQTPETAQELVPITGKKNQVTSKPDYQQQVYNVDSSQEMVPITGNRKQTTTVSPDRGSFKAELFIRGRTNSTDSTVTNVGIDGSSFDDGIEGHIFEVFEASNIRARNEDTYVEIATGNACSRQMEVKLVGSTLHCNCDNHNVSIEYIGQGPVDMEISHATFMVEGKQWSSRQNEDSILLYGGAIPQQVRDRTSESIMIRGVTASRDTTEDSRVVEVVGRGPDMKRYQRQIVVVGINRTCYEYLMSSTIDGRHIVECARIDTEEVRVVGEAGNQPGSQEIFISGRAPTDSTGSMEEVVGGAETSGTTRPLIQKGEQENTFDMHVAHGHENEIGGVNNNNLPVNRPLPWDKSGTGFISLGVEPEVRHVERLFLIMGMETVDIGHNDDLQISFQDYECGKADSFEVVVIDNDLRASCGGEERPVIINYVGREPTDVYFSRSMYSTGSTTSRQHGVNVVMGGRTAGDFEDRQIVEIIKNVSSHHTAGVRRVVSFGGISTSEHSRSVLEIGFTHGCNGKLEKVVKQDVVIINCVTRDVLVTGGHTSETQEIVISGSSGARQPTVETEEIVISGGGRTEEKSAEVHQMSVVISGGISEQRPVEVETEVRGEIIVDTVTELPRVPQKVEKTVRGTIIVDTVTEKPKPTTTTSTTTTSTTTSTTTPAPTTTTTTTTTPTPQIEIIKEGRDVKMFRIAGERERIATTTVQPPREVQRMFVVGTPVNTTQHKDRNKPVRVANPWAVIEKQQKDRGGRVFGTWQENMKSEVLQKAVQKFFLVGQSEFVNINNTEQSVEIGFKDNCDGDYNVISSDKFLRVQCGLVDSRELEIQVLIEEQTEVEVSTSVRLEKQDGAVNSRDKVYIHLGGNRLYTGDHRNVRTLQTNARTTEQQEGEVVFVDGLTESNDDTIKVVEIGIRQSCKRGNIEKYVDEHGTLVYCTQRADIMPDSSEYDDSSGKREKFANIRRIGMVGVMNGHHGRQKSDIYEQGFATFMETQDPERKEFDVKVTSQRVDPVSGVNRASSSRDAVLAPVINTGSHYVEHGVGPSYQQEDRVTIDTVYGAYEQVTHGRRGDVALETEYDVQRSNNLHKNKKANGVRQIDLHLNQSLDIDVGNNCRGKIEAVEVDNGVVVKCTVANKTFELNLVGYGKLNGDRGTSVWDVQNDSPTEVNMFHRGVKGFIAERTVQMPGLDGKTKSIQEVYFASPKQKIELARRALPLTGSERHGEAMQRDGVMAWGEGHVHHTADDWLQGDDPEVYFVERPVFTGPRRGDMDMEYEYAERKRRKRSAVLEFDQGQRGPCNPPFFNSDARTQDECVRCFCFGQTVQCFSSDLQVSRIAPANPLEFVRREADETLTTIDPSYVNTNTRTGEYDVQDLYRALPQGRYYWKLPREFLGDRLTSYGGELKYTIYYEIAGRRQSNVNEMDVVLVGNGERLFYRASVQPTPGVQTSISVPLIESAWERTESTTRRGDTEIDSEYADRTDLMMALQNVEYILIRGSYDRQQTVSKIGGVYMSTAVDYPTEYGQAYLVEECTCPTGYTGRSCQECASGFTRVQNGQYLGQCVSCNCNGHSNDCDAITGNCLNCQHNTYGPQCQLCRDGYYGDARRGTANDCQACPCPLTDPANQFSRTCYLDSDGDVTCANCPLGYEGRRCQRCAQGYVGDPMTPGSSCTKTTVDKYCDPRGSLSEQPNPLTGRCECKENAVGTRCDSCKENTFYLSRTYELGCVRCFCMGVSSTCQSTSWTRSQLSLAMSRDSDKVNIVDTLGQSLEDQRGLSVDASNREVRYRGVGSDTVYFALPSRFLGDRVTAYGGSLRFTISYTSQQGATVSPAEPLVQLSGNDITLVSRVSQTFEPNRPQSVNIMMYEQNWFRVDGSPATREHLLMALADLDSLYIRATYERPQASVSLRDVSLDIAEDRATNLDRAYAVEQCVCPVGYRGLSCEDCATGFTRSGGGLYLGLCVPCQCNGHANECDPETGVCRNCQHNTAGDSCEQCAVGYYGQIRGRPDDCSKCPCPMTEAPNQFSPTCQYDPRGASRPGSGDVICTNCPAGHTGRRCESCIEGYTGNPLVVGDYCKVGPTNVCDCDSRGTVPNVQCDPNTKECKCKPYVQGVRCARCREGYFYLEANNPQGCLKCFCSGITNQCTSSRYNREALGSDSTHNFALMNRRMNNLVSDGFIVDNARNQITFGPFEGVQRERESLFFQLPAKFRGDQVTSYGGYLRFTLEFDSRPTGRQYRDVDVEIISADQNRMYHLLEEPLREGQTQTYEILLRESSFNDLTNAAPTRETFMTILSNIEGFLIRATYNTEMVSITLRDVSMDTAVPTTTNLGGAPMVEDCRCPEGYTGLSCERCADGYLRVSDGRGGLGRCVRCNCNGHADSCDPETGRCLNCNDNTQGDRCDQCIDGYYGDATSGTPNDCRRCPCPLTTAPNQFSPTCYLAEDNQVTCDRCPTGYTGRQCDRCAAGYEGDPIRPGDSCKRQDVGPRPEVVVSPVRVEEPVGSTVVFQCQVRGQGPFNVVWSRLDSRQLPERASVSPTYTLTIRDLQVDDSSRYVCTATNRAGVTRQDVELRVISGGRPLQVRIDQTRIEVQEGRTARFICSVVSGFNEMYILSWSRQGAQMPVKANDQNGVLVIPNVQRSDAGNYVCMGSDLTYMDEEVAVLIVVDSADQAPVARIEPRYQTVNEGEEVRFQCVATGNPRPRIEWVRGGNRDMNPAAVITSDGLLRIPRAQVTDESEYFCRAINEHGTTEVRTLLYVTPVDRPTITVIVRQTKVISAVGQTARLECYVEDSTGRVTVFWSRASGLPLGSSQSNGLLTIPNVQPSYAGNYVCTGTDEDTGRVSTAIAELEVRVQETAVAPTVVVEPENITIPMGSTGTLRCRATGTPEPTVKWMKSREELSSNHQVTGTTLRITNAMMADRGIYVCRAENSAGMDQDWSIVEVERRMRPKIDLYPNSTQLIPVGGSALFQCRVMDGDPPPRITWSKVGGGAMSSRVDTMENGVIMFKQAAQEDQGSYLCTAENDMGVITATATLIVEGPPTIIIQPSRTVYAVIGQRVTLECSADGDPTPSVYWMEPRPRRRGDVALEAEFASFGTPGSAVLDINSVERDDQGTYTCVATNSGGRSEDRVQLIIREGGGDSTGVSITGPSTLSVVEGQTVELICTASDIRNPVIRWRRRDGLLPPGHSVRNGVLTLPQFRQEYGGEYICSTVTATDTYEATVFIIVTVAPRLVISPQRITARAGEAVQLRCTPSGSGPFNIEWSRVGAQMNPRAVERDGILEIRQVTAADAGTYRCVVQSSAGRNEGTAIVYVEIPPSVSVRRRDVYTETNRIATLECDVRGSPTPTVRWEKEGDQLPAQHRIQDGVLTIYNVQEEDAGRYICTAQSSAGSSREFAVLHVSSGGVSPGENVDSQFVNVGDRVSMECIVTGSPLPTIQWTREDSPLPASAILGDGILIIPSAHVEDAGTYTCHATNNLGTLKSKVILYVTAEPQLTAPAAATAALGDSVSLVCDAQGYPSPAITWFRKDGEMPPDYQIVDGDLLIQRVRSEDAGTYYCHAENTYGKKDMPVNLHVGALVPRFLQEPNSYIAYQPLNDVYIDFDILLSLKPESTEGTVLYNGQYEDGGGDFVCFGLNEGYPEFRFDVGSGPAIIRGNDKLALNEWHTVKLTRNRKKGSMIVNEGPAYTGESPGSFIGLDLEGDLYLGSVPDYNNIPKVAGFKEGFHGSVSELKLKGISVNLGAEALEIVGVEPTNTCRQNPCANGATCAAANTRYGYMCMCPQGYMGSRCQEIGERCYQGACGAEGRCYNLDGKSGFACICPLGKTGTGCMADVPIINPFFNQSSFISYPAPDNALFNLNLYLEYKPQSLRDGILLYEGNDRDGSGDFMSLVQKDGYLEFRFDTGSGPAIVRSRNPLRVGEWTRVSASRKNREGTLVINNEDPVTGVSPGSTVGLNLKLPMYLGGVDPTIKVSPNAGASVGFVGCMAELKVNDATVELLTAAVESLNIVDCGERRLCERRPCKNGAVCEDLPGPDFKCLCPSTHMGKTCDVEINICLTNSPCQNGASCSITDDGYRCDCPLGYAGDNCETSISLDTDFSFISDSFMEFPKALLPHARTQERQTISFNMKTTQSDGLMIWQGEPDSLPLNAGDYIAIGLQEGYVVFSYDMGSGAAKIMSRKRVDDGQVHSVSVERLGRTGTLTVDTDDSAYGDSQGFLQMLNANGNIYVGGVPLVKVMTDKKYKENFVGCIDSITIHGKGPLSAKDALSGFNVEQCAP